MITLDTKYTDGVHAFENEVVRFGEIGTPPQELSFSGCVFECVNFPAIPRTLFFDGCVFAGCNFPKSDRSKHTLVSCTLLGCSGTLYSAELVMSTVFGGSLEVIP